MKDETPDFEVYKNGKIQGYEKLTPDGWMWRSFDTDGENCENWYRGVFPYGFKYERKSALQSRIEELQRENQEFERLKSENSRLRKACEVVVKGYENDGMEDMSFRDRVFYQACKEALEKEK